MSLSRMRMAVALHEPEISEEVAKADFFSCVQIFHRKNSPEFETIARAYKIVELEYLGTHRSELDVKGNKKPYLSHLRTVAFALMFLNFGDSTTLVVALLHDLREDFPQVWPYQRLVEIFGTEVAEEVESITRPYDDGRLDRASRRVKLIKVIDRLHNMKTYKHLYTPEKLERKVRQTIREILPIATEIGFSDELQFFLKQWVDVELTEAH